MLVVVLPWVPATHRPRLLRVMRPNTCARHAQAAAAAGDETQHLRTLVQLEAMFAKPHQLGVVGGHGGGIDHERRVRASAIVGDEVGIFFEVQACSFGYELLGQGAGRAVVAGHLFAPRQEVADEGTHADASCADEIDGLYAFYVHDIFLY